MPIPKENQLNFPILQYANDSLLIMQADVTQFICLKGLLEAFAQSTGLKVNY